jgi:hypothetical protein
MEKMLSRRAFGASTAGVGSRGAARRMANLYKYWSMRREKFPKIKNMRVDGDTPSLPRIFRRRRQAFVTRISREISSDEESRRQKAESSQDVCMS